MADVAGVNLIADGDMVVRAQKQRGQFEPESLELWKAKAIPGSVMVDVGAYTGLYSIAAALKGADVVAIEPNPKAADRLVDNCQANGVCVTLIRSAAWHRPTTILMQGGDPLSSAWSARKQGDNGMTVDAIRIDDLGLKGVSAMKIDAERAEPEVIAGALKTIERDLPLLLIEELDLSSMITVSAMLQPLGYRREKLSQNMIAWT